MSVDFGRVCVSSDVVKFLTASAPSIQLAMNVRAIINGYDQKAISHNENRGLTWRST